MRPESTQVKIGVEGVVCCCSTKAKQKNEWGTSGGGHRFLLKKTPLIHSRAPLSDSHISGWLIGLPGACVLTGGGGWALDVDVIDMADECGTLVDVDDERVGIVKLDVLIERGGAAPGSVPPMPGTPAKPPVYPLGPPEAPLGRQRRLKSEAEESSEEDMVSWFLLCFFLFCLRSGKNRTSSLFLLPLSLPSSLFSLPPLLLLCFASASSSFLSVFTQKLHLISGLKNTASPHLTSPLTPLTARHAEKS